MFYKFPYFCVAAQLVELIPLRKKVDGSNPKTGCTLQALRRPPTAQKHDCLVKWSL